MKMSQWKKMLNENSLVTEASEVSYSEMPEETRKILKKIKLDKSIESAWDGLHGDIIRFGGTHGLPRLTKKDMQQLLKDKNFRWIDIQAIGV